MSSTLLDDNEDSVSNLTLQRLAYFALLGLLGIIVYALHFGRTIQFATVAGIGLLSAGASLMTGGLLGFLFGIPQSKSEKTSAQPPSEQKSSSDADTTPVATYQPNTNLEQVSDWLTKIIVGVGLTQIAQIPAKMKQLASYLSPGLGGTDNSQIFAMALLVYFLACGFLIGYLWTRLYLPGAFRMADLEALGKRVGLLQQQQQTDALALTMAERQVNPNTAAPALLVEKVKEAIKNASPSVKVQVFYRAEQLRSQTWRTEKSKMERTIPIFEALIESDPEDNFHRNHGQLGFALKDKINPDWQRAEQELTRAIQIRDKWNQGGWRFYEFNRAICRIRLDPNFTQGKVSDPDRRNLIFSDVRAAVTGDLKAIADQDQTIQDWLKLNNLQLS